MKLTKEIIKLIDKRKKYGELLNEYEEKVTTWCNENGVYITDIESEFGCMLSTEPLGYAEMTVKRIKETSNEEEL